MAARMPKGKKITNIEVLLERIHSGKPVKVRNYIYSAEQAGTYSLDYWIKALQDKVVFEHRDLEHFDSGVTVGELINCLAGFKTGLNVQITGLYGSDTETICGFKEEDGKLIIMTDLCTG